MKKTLTYKGFTGSVEPQEDGTFYGSVQGIGALIMYEGDDEAELEKYFREGVDDHLDYCEEGGWDPYDTSQMKTPAATLKSAVG